MTKKIDASISAKLQACSINYNFYIKKLFGNVFGVDQELGLAIQFSPMELINIGSLSVVWIVKILQSIP